MESSTTKILKSKKTSHGTHIELVTYFDDYTQKDLFLVKVRDPDCGISIRLPLDITQAREKVAEKIYKNLGNCTVHSVLRKRFPERNDQ